MGVSRARFFYLIFFIPFFLLFLFLFSSEKGDVKGGGWIAAWVGWRAWDDGAT